MIESAYYDFDYYLTEDDGYGILVNKSSKNSGFSRDVITAKAAVEALPVIAKQIAEHNGWDNRGMFVWDFEPEMLELSRQHPEVLIRVLREGEDRDDNAHYYFLNGKVQSCYGEVVYPPFDSTKLQNSIY